MKIILSLLLTLVLFFGGCKKEEAVDGYKPTEETKVNASTDSLADSIIGKVITLNSSDEENKIVGLMLQFYGDGRMTTGDNEKLEEYYGLTYKIERNEVLVFNDGESSGRISFSSSSPKVGDQVDLGLGRREEKVRGKIAKIEAANEILSDSTIKDKHEETTPDKPNLKNDPVDETNKTKNVPISDLLMYKITDESVSIVGCKRDSEKIIIPEKIENKIVTEIGSAAFAYRNFLTNITIPSGVKSIKDTSFGMCANLVSVSFEKESQLNEIGNGAFSGCNALTEFDIPESVKSIGFSAFSRCSSLITVRFFGDAPKEGEDVFKNTSATIYRKPEAKGWGDTWAGRPVKLISEKP